MTIVVRPAAVFEDVRALIGPKRPDANVCWCLSHRIPATLNASLRGPERGAYVEELCGKEVAPGVLAYEGGEPVAWAAVAPRSEVSGLTRSRTIPKLDELPVWSIWCIRVRPGFRRRGLVHPLLEGAVAFAKEHGAPLVEGYPVDNGDQRVDLTMAFVGTRAMFERAGFSWASQTASTISGFPRIVMRRDLR